MQTPQYVDPDPMYFVEKSKYFTATHSTDGEWNITFAENEAECVDLNSLPPTIAESIRGLDKLQDLLPKEVPNSQAVPSSSKEPASPSREIKQGEPEKNKKRPREEDNVILITESPTESPTEIQGESKPVIEDADSDTDDLQSPEKKQKVSHAFTATLTAPEELPPSKTLSRSLKHIVRVVEVHTPSGAVDLQYQVQQVGSDETPSDLEGLPEQVVADVNQLDTEYYNHNT
jgi:hypothetical protein